MEGFSLGYGYGGRYTRRHIIILCRYNPGMGFLCIRESPNTASPFRTATIAQLRVLRGFVTHPEYWQPVIPLSISNPYISGSLCQ
jgi:hypothetical protein